MKYIYKMEGVPPVELDGSLNQIIAWRQAEQDYGEGGRLFREIPPSPEPVASAQTLEALRAYGTKEVRFHRFCG